MDYSRKRFNYKGIICLESSIAWGFLGIIYFRFLNGFVNQAAGFIPENFNVLQVLFLLIFYATDFVYTMRLQLRADCEEDESSLVGRLKVY